MMCDSKKARPVVVCVLLLLCGSRFGFGQDAQSDTAVDRTTMVIMAPGGPVFAQMQVLVDGQSYRTWVTEFLARKLDIDRDDSLKLSELKLIPARLMQQSQAGTAKRLLRLASKDSKAESITVDQFSQWFASQLSRSFNIIAGAVQASDAVRLAALIDENGDGGVAEDELRRGGYALRFRDLDDDQTFSASELMPFRDPRNQQAAVIPDVANLPFVQLTDEASKERTAQQLLNRYGDGQSMACSKLRLPQASTTSFDSDGDDRLNDAECRALLSAPAYHVDLRVLLSDRSNASSLDIRPHAHAVEFCRAESLRRGRAKLVLDDMPVEIRARGGGTNTRTFFTSFLMQRMSLYDEDRNNYLSEDEFPQMQQQMAQQSINASFEDVDLDGDGMLFREEVMGYIERDTISTQSRIEVSVKQDGKTLFSLLDQNADRRLTPRELQHGFDALLEYDVNGDRTLMESELGTAYVLEIGLAQAEALRVDTMRGMGMMNQSTDAVLPGVGGLSGPEWFRRMDRNQDRDVSYREFLGPRELFEELDADHDGLMSAEEAAALYLRIRGHRD